MPVYNVLVETLELVTTPHWISVDADNAAAAFFGAQAAARQNRRIAYHPENMRRFVKAVEVVAMDAVRHPDLIDAVVEEDAEGNVEVTVL